MLSHHEGLSRFFFVVCVITCFGMLFYQWYQLAFEFANQPYVSKLYTVVDKSLDYPYLRTAVEEHKISWVVLEYIMENFVDGLLAKRTYTSLELDVYDAQLDGIATMINTSMTRGKPTDIFDKIFLPCQAVMVACYWMGVEFNCCRNFTNTYTNYGLCYVFQPVGFQQQQIGPGNGLRVRMLINRQLEPMSRFNRPTDVGALVVCASLFTPVISDPAFIPAGYRGYLELSTTQYKRKENCALTYPANRYTKGLKNSKSSCRYECLLDKLVNSCNCMFFSYNTTPPIRNSSYKPVWYCTPRELATCARTHVMNRLPELVHDCAVEKRTQCPEPCDFWDYSTKPSFARINPERIATGVEARFGKQFPINETVDIQLYFAAIEHDVIEEVLAQGMDQFICNMASMIDLWIGFSAFAISRFLVLAMLAFSSKITWSTVSNIVMKEDEEHHAIVPRVSWKKTARRISRAFDITKHWQNSKRNSNATISAAADAEQQKRTPIAEENAQYLSACRDGDDVLRRTSVSLGWKLTISRLRYMLRATQEPTLTVNKVDIAIPGTADFDGDVELRQRSSSLFSE